jgi:hypothetical protein
MWVLPSSFGVSSLTRRARSQLSPNSGLCGAPHKPEFGDSWLRARLVKLETPNEDGSSHIALWQPRDR